VWAENVSKKKVAAGRSKAQLGVTALLGLDLGINTAAALEILEQNPPDPTMPILKDCTSQFCRK
jgi:hypothetical protein